MLKSILLLICLAFFLGACNLIDTVNNESTNSAGNTSAIYDMSAFKEYPLLGVIDGDTIKIRYNGSDESVRLLLVDTPETNHEIFGEQPYGQEAKAFMEKLLAGQDTVFIEFDVTLRDKYERLLGYVYTADGKSVQEELLKNGLARVAYIYEPNTKHVDWFESEQNLAKKQEIGIWSVDNYVTENGYDKNVFVDSNTEKKDIPDTSCTVKGNINSKGKKIYHVPGQQNYEATKPEEVFCSTEEAEAAGYQAAQR